MNIYRSMKTGQMSSKRSRRGQSLVEFALTLPVLLTILAGVVEVANILMIYNRVQLAAREGARFGAMGGTNAGILDVVKQSSNVGLQATNDQMKVWVIRPTIQVSGSPVAWSWNSPATLSPAPGIWGTTAVCVFPLAAPAGPGCTDTSPLTPTQLINDIKGINNTTTNPSIPLLNGTNYVAAVVQYDADMILRLPWFSPQATTSGRFRMWAYAVMQQEVEESAVAQKSAGCSAYGIALSDYAIVGNDIETKRFTVALNDENSGEGGRKGFKFLTWRLGDQQPGDLTSANACGATMSFPGNSIGCTKSYTENPVTDPPDTSLHRGDWVVAHASGKMATVWSELTSAIGHFSTGRKLRIIVYKYQAGSVNPRNTIGAWQYRIDDFAIVRLILTGSDQNSNPNLLTFEWVKWDNSCGYEE